MVPVMWTLSPACRVSMTSSVSGVRMSIMAAS
jgi:hypothetical protein